MALTIIVLTSVFLVASAEQNNIFSNEHHRQRYDKSQHEEDSPAIIVVSEESDLHSVEDREDPFQQPKYRGKQVYKYDEEGDDGTYDESLVDTIPGRAGKDFPAYSEIPKTSFSCSGRRESGYFADPETDCQVFHICVANGQKISFLCPNGSIFNQKVSVCDWWYDVDCQTSSQIVDFTNDIQKERFFDNPDFQYNSFIVEHEPYDLSLASSGGNEHPRKNKNENAEKAENNRETVKSNENKTTQKEKPNQTAAKKPQSNSSKEKKSQKQDEIPREDFNSYEDYYVETTSHEKETHDKVQSKDHRLNLGKSRNVKI